MNYSLNDARNRLWPYLIPLLIVMVKILLSFALRCLTKWKEEENSFQPSVTQECSPAGAGAGDMTE